MQSFGISQSHYLEASSSWVNIFPFGIQIFNLIENPNKNGILYAVTKEGVFVTENSGLFWHPLVLYEQLQQSNEITWGMMIFDPTDYHTMYLTISWDRGGKLWRTTDNGQRWEVLGEKIIQGSIWSIGIPLSQNQIMYAATSSGLYKSLNAGKSWGKIYDRECWKLRIDSQNPDKVFFIAASTRSDIIGQTIYASSNAGKTFSELKIRFPSVLKNYYGDRNVVEEPTRVGGYSINTQYSDHILALNGGFLIKSEDGGSTWVKLVDRIKNIAWDYGSENKNLIFVAYYIEYDQETKGPVYKLLKSDNEGVSWSELCYPAIGIPPSLLFISNSGALFLVADGIYKSTDSGQSWERTHFGLPANTSGFSSIAFDPKDSSCYLSAQIGFWKVSENGKEWQFAHLKKKDTKGDGYSPSQIFWNEDNSQYFLWRNYYEDSFWKGGLAGGHMFRKASPLSDIEELNLSFLPYCASTLSSDGTRLLLIGAPNTSNYNGNYPSLLSKSEDAGFSWIDIEWSKFISKEPTSLSNSIGYISVNPKKSQVFVVISNRILVSNDNGDKWTDISGKVSKALGNNAGKLISILFDIKDAKNIFLTSQFDGIIQSMDGGITWKPFLTKRMTVYKSEIFDFINHASIPNVFISSTDLGVFISKDRGLSWQPMNNGIFPKDRIKKIVATTSFFLLQGSKGLYSVTNKDIMK